LAVTDELECLSLVWEKGESIFEYEDEILLLLF